ncbi:MAG: tetratricopeptide repeat protein [Prevotella sp.]|nr:tetratricopeptide repeat protein [Prevotella sp.]
MAQNNNKQGAPEVVETLSKNEAFVLKYKNAIIAAVVVVILAIVGGIYWKEHLATAQAKASTEMAKAQEAFAQAMQLNTPEAFQLALNGDSLGHTGFLALTDASGKAGNLANLYAGLCYAHLGQMEDAAKYLEKFDLKGDQMVSPAVLGALGNVYASLDQLDKAVSTLKKAAEKADNNALSPQFLIQAGEILESQGQKAEALKLYQEVKDKYFQSAQYQLIDEYIERVSE